MIKLSFCLNRLPGLSRLEFQKYWFEKHAPLVKKHSSVLRIRRYVQTHALSTPFNDAIRASREAPEMYDGVAELWWDSLDDLMAPGGSEEGRAAGLALLEDERKFIDLPRSPLWLSEEKPIFG
jgi:uncharacterized protein (TIGR02118 family)